MDAVASIGHHASQSQDPRPVVTENCWDADSNMRPMNVETLETLQRLNRIGDAAAPGHCG